LNAIAPAAPDWLRGLAPAGWHERYDRRVEDMRLPDAGPKRDAYAAQVGADGFVLLDALDGAEAPIGLRDLPEVAVLRRVWARHFERVGAGSGGNTGGDHIGQRTKAARNLAICKHALDASDRVSAQLKIGLIHFFDAADRSR